MPRVLFVPCVYKVKEPPVALNKVLVPACAPITCPRVALANSNAMRRRFTLLTSCFVSSAESGIERHLCANVVLHLLLRNTQGLFFHQLQASAPLVLEIAPV